MNEPAVVVTGASTGIGRACALHLDSLGLRVFAGVRRQEDGEALQAIASDRLIPIRIDVTDARQIEAAVATVEGLTRDSGLAGLVNNAGVALAGPLEFVSTDDLRWQLEVNVVGQMAVTTAFLPMLRTSRGRIVFMSSVAGKLAQPMLAPYCASKHALEALADCLRLELRPWGIRVALIEPGAVATPIWEKGASVADALLAKAPPQIYELYGAAIDVARDMGRRAGEAGVSPLLVASAVADALISSRPRIRYRVGRDARIVVPLRRLLPDWLADEIIMRYTGLPRRESQVRGTAPSAATAAAR